MGKTMAKPTFRELAFVATDDPITGRTFKGNPSLEPSSIDNFDIRFDWNLSDSEILAISAFLQKNSQTNPADKRKSQQSKSEASHTQLMKPLF